MLKSIYLQQVYSDLTARDPEQKEFHQAVREVLESLDLMIDSHPEYREAALLERLPKEYGKDRVFLSVYDDNQGAIRLYEKLGFAFNGELDTKGERVMVYTVPRPDAPTEREERERAHDRSV